MGRSISLCMRATVCVSACVGIPVEEWYVLGRHFYEAGSILDQASSQETSSTEPTGVVTLAIFLGLLLDVEGLALLRVE